MLQAGLQGNGAFVAGLKISTGLSRSVGGLREISLPLQQRWHRRKLIERIFRALSVVINEIKSLAATVVDVGNVQRPTHGTAETILQICRFFRRLSGQRKWRRIQSRIADAVI